jgi:Rrf2 family cysteine metabolism transcriptional repressor
MKMTTRGRYGLRAMLELARRFGEKPVLASVLASQEALSLKYLHTLLTSLKSAGLVASVRGPGGGFQLTRSPATIRLSEVLRAVEGPLSLVECVTCPTRCKRATRCTARRVWSHLSETIEGVLDSLTLERLLQLEASDDNEHPRGERLCTGNKRRTGTTGRSVRRTRHPKESA